LFLANRTATQYDRLLPTKCVAYLMTLLFPTQGSSSSSSAANARTGMIVSVPEGVWSSTWQS